MCNLFFNRHQFCTDAFYLTWKFISLIYFFGRFLALVTIREGANKSYGTRAFTGNPLILND